MIYNISVKQYRNSAHGTRYNISASVPQFRKSPSEVDNSIPTYGGEKVGRRVRPPEQRDRTSILRAIRNIREIGLSNDWDYFVTFTLDPKKFDRSDYASACLKMTRYLRDLRKEYECGFQYLLIPELHRDGHNWHFHGLMSGIPDSLLVPHPLEWQEKQGYKDWPDFSKRFGFVSLSPVTNTSAVVYYCLKYINKDIFAKRLNNGMRLYYVSRGISRPQEVSKFTLNASPELLNVYGFDVTQYSTGYVRSLPEDIKNNFINQFFFTEEFYKE